MDDLVTIVEKNNNLPNVTLDFDALRTEGTAYIAQLGHRLWTDFNVHDPGITMLEVLCFAINDLAFRSSFPMQDLLAEAEPQYAKKQFYTAAEILSCCPVTPLDFRKVIIDVEGVKNAWVFKSGPEGKNLYRQYFLNKTKDELSALLDLVKGLIKENPDFPITKSCCEFLEVLDRKNLEYGNFGQWLCHLVTYETQALVFRHDLKDMFSIMEYLQNDQKIENYQKKEDLQSIVIQAKQGEIREVKDLSGPLLNVIYYKENAGRKTLFDHLGTFFGDIKTIHDKIIAKKQNFIFSELDLRQRLIDVGITEVEIQDSVLKLVARPAKHIYLIREDIKELQNRIDPFINSFIQYEAERLSEKTWYDSTDLRDGFIEKIRSQFVEKDPINGLKDSKFFINPFFWMISCRLHGNDTKSEIRERVINLLDCLIAIHKKRIEIDKGFKGFVLENQVLSQIIDGFNLTDYENEVLDMLDCFALPGRALRSDDQLNKIVRVINGYSELPKDKLLITELTNIPSIEKLFWDPIVVYCEPDDFKPEKTIPSKEALNGLYDICIELEDRINPEDILAVNAIKTSVRRKMAAYRNLDEDFCDIDVVGVKPICIEANITVADKADVNEVMAGIIYRVQKFLSTGPQFNSLKEMQARGFSCDEIFQGPMLDNGFLDDDEVENARLRRVIYKSDLYQEIIDVDGVVALTCLKIKLCRPEDRVCAYDNEWCLDICQKEQSEADIKLLKTVGATTRVEKYAANISCKYKPLLNIQGSKICFQKGGLLMPTDSQDVSEKLELTELLNRRPPVNEEMDMPVPVGNYRDLNRYRSIQEDFPMTYRIGKEQISSSFPKERQAQVKQLKAYLTFFDQLLANYLAQLGKLKDNLSVSANPANPVLASSSIMGLDTNIDALFFQMYQMNDEAIQNLTGLVPDQFKDELAAMKTLPPMHREPFLRAVKEALSFNTEEKPAQKTEISIDKQRTDSLQVVSPAHEHESSGQEDDNPGQKGDLPSDETEITNHKQEESVNQQISPIQEPISPTQEIEKQALKTDDEKVMEILLANAVLTPDYLVNQMSQMVENDLERHQRRNKILDHMIARFGERFADYALSLYCSSPEDPCKAAKINIKDDLLHCKTEFLKSIPIIGSHRGKGFDYMDKDCCTQDELFWKTDNVPGMQKRVSRLLCLKQTGRAQLSCQPKVTVEKDVDEENSVYTYVVVDSERAPNDPKRTVYLRGIKEYTLRGKVKRELDKMRHALLNANRKIEVGNHHTHLFVDGVGPFYLRLQDAAANVLAESQALNTKEAAENFRDELVHRIFPDDCETEGFHVIEHILLRPISKTVPSLAPIDLCGCKVDDPYSFWISVVALDKWKRFSVENGGRAFFEQTVRRETPAHIGICFLWLSGEQMFRFEEAYKNWLYDLVRLEADDCQIEESLSALVMIMNELLKKICPDPCQEVQKECCP